jgi:hypothetical protein
VQSYVDAEGDVIWTQEYLRYRLSGCSHEDSYTKVFTQITGGGVPADCTPIVVTPPPPPPTNNNPPSTSSCPSTPRPTNCNFYFNPNLVYVDYRGQNFRLPDGTRVDSLARLAGETRPACTWSVSNSTPWISIQSPRGTVCPPTLSVDYSVSANPNYTERSGEFVAGVGSSGGYMTIRQDPAPAPLTFTIMDRGGTGLVTSNPSDLSCRLSQIGQPRTCTAHFAPGTYVTLTATPDSGSSILYWLGECVNAGSSRFCSFTMPPHAVDASVGFQKP